MKYPDIVMGGLAASAPFGFVGTHKSPSLFALAASFTFEDAQPGCGTAIKSSLATFMELTKSQSGRDQIHDKFKLCGNEKLSETEALEVANWLITGFLDMCMLDYPYPTDYGISLPGWPVNKTCERIVSGYKEDAMKALAYGIGIFYNSTGSLSCYNITTDVPSFAAGWGWPYLACTDTYMPFELAGIFPESKWNLTADKQNCKEQFGIELREEWPKEHWGGYELEFGSNIIFSNGLLDPWHSIGILNSLSESLVAITIPEAAHHLDLREPNEADPHYVKLARTQEETLIYAWLSDYFFL